MIRRHCSIGAVALCMAAVPVYADIAAIHGDALPQQTAVLSALDDARQTEPYSRRFVSPWDFQITKDEVAAHLGKDLGFLEAAAKAHPENAELLLLTGLVARYAYNVDVERSYDTAMDVLAKAEKLAPTDVRAAWFRSTLLCQTMQPKSGAEGFLAIEGAHDWHKLPPAFWDDYMECATITAMPAHALRAADHLKALGAPESQMRSFLAGVNAKRFEPFDADKKYEPNEVWWSNAVGDDQEFTSTMCGVRLRVPGKWGVNQLGFGNGSCIAYFSTGPYQGTKHSLRPSILLLVQRPKEGEGIEDYAKKFMKDATFAPFEPSRCPAAACTALRAVQPGMYGKDGDGHGRIVVFERDEPEFPAVQFESPSQPPSPDGKSGGGVQYYRPPRVRSRIPGKLYYLVVLDVAASIEQPAMEDFDSFLKNLTVE